jgi:hypothetical protein
MGYWQEIDSHPAGLIPEDGAPALHKGNLVELFRTIMNPVNGLQNMCQITE